MDIVVLCGGNSTEREVSINSGYNVCQALREKGHNAVLMDVFFGLKNIDIFNQSKEDYDIEKERDYVYSLSAQVAETEQNRKSFLEKM